MSRAVLIFGTFNPVTNAHINMGVCSRMKYPDAEIIYVPSNDKFIKKWKKYDDGMMLGGNERVLLLYNAIRKYGFNVSSIEVDGIVDGRTYNTIQYYKIKNPIICIGADKLCEIHKWYNSEEIVRDNKFLVVTRNNEKGNLHDSLISFYRNFDYIEGAYQDISSTQIREAYVNKRLDMVKNYVPEYVYKYLKNTNNVYTREK